MLYCLVFPNSRLPKLSSIQNYRMHQPSHTGSYIATSHLALLKMSKMCPMAGSEPPHLSGLTHRVQDATRSRWHPHSAVVLCDGSRVCVCVGGGGGVTLNFCSRLVSKKTCALVGVGFFLVTVRCCFQSG